jgi:hypothetical protein
VTIIDCDQGSPEWFRARMGIPTASMFGTVMAKGKNGGASLTRQSYMHKLAGEILTGEPMESYSNGDMERGRAMEDEARNAYYFQTGADLRQVGFIKGSYAGCSPDALIMDGANSTGGLEIKCASPHIQIARLLDGRMPPEHAAQVQGGMWITGAECWDFVSYCPRLPLLIVRVPRDDGKIAEIAGAVRQFNEELAQVVERIRRVGA